MNPPSLPKTSGLAITSLVLGIIGLCCPLFLVPIAAVICGHIARGKIRDSGGTLGGAGQALAGLLLGYISLALSVLGAILWTVAAPKIAPYMEMGYNVAYAQQIHMAMESMVEDGVEKNDTSLGWPADAGITTATELKKRLVDGGYLGANEAAVIDFNKFLFANVSASDPESMVFIRLKPEFSPDATVYVSKDGEQQVLPGEVTVEDPPRTPPYLEP